MIGFDVINLDLWIRSKQLLQRLKNTPKNIITVQEFMLLPFLISFNCPKNINPRSMISACNISYRLKHNSRRLWGLSIFFSVMSWIIDSKRSGPKYGNWYLAWSVPFLTKHEEVRKWDLFSGW